MHSIILVFDSHIPPHFHYIDCHQHLFSLPQSLSCWQTQSGNICCGTQIPLLWPFQVLAALVLLYSSPNVCGAIVIGVIWIIQVAIPVQQMFIVQLLSGVLSSSLLTG
jgi:hypothetical protein